VSRRPGCGCDVCGCAVGCGRLSQFNEQCKQSVGKGAKWTRRLKGCDGCVDCRRRRLSICRARRPGRAEVWGPEDDGPGAKMPVPECSARSTSHADRGGVHRALPPARPVQSDRSHPPPPVLRLVLLPPNIKVPRLHVCNKRRTLRSALKERSDRVERGGGVGRQQIEGGTQSWCASQGGAGWSA
jgi:hypothetical protein